MRPVLKKLLLGVGVYFALWGVTRLTAPWVLERQMQKEALADWQRYRVEQDKKGERGPGSGETMAFAAGPRVEVELLSCPAPFVFEAKCGRMIGGLNGYGTVSRFFLTPWRAYVISEVHTWVS